MIQSTREVKSIIYAVKSAFSKKTIFTSNLYLTLWMKLVKSCIWSIALYGVETFDNLEINQKYLESSEIWCWGRMEQISWTDHVRNEEV